MKIDDENKAEEPFDKDEGVSSRAAEAEDYENSPGSGEVKIDSFDAVQLETEEFNKSESNDDDSKPVGEIESEETQSVSDEGFGDIDEDLKERNESKIKDSKKKKSRRAKRSSQSRKKSIMSALMTFLFMVALVLFNVLLSVLTDKYAVLTVDLTSSGNFTLTDTSIELAQSLEKEVDITFLCTKDEYESIDSYCVQTTGLASQYEQYSSMITVNYVDITSNPTYTENYPDEDLSSTDVIISCGDRYLVLTYKDMYNMEYYDSTYTYQYIESSMVESAFDTAIMNVIVDELTPVTMVVDNASEDYDYLVRFLESNNYSVTTINIEDEDIPEDTELLILFTPDEDYSAEKAQDILDFLTNDEEYGKVMLYVPASSDVSTPNIDALLEVYGLEVERSMAFDMDTDRIYGYNYYDGLACTFASTLFTDLIDMDDDYPVIVSYSRGVTITNEDYATALLCLSSESGVCDFDADEDTWSMEDSITGYVIVGAYGERGLSEDVNSRVVVMGSATMFTETILGSDFSDDRYISAMLATLCGNEIYSVTIADKTLTYYDLTISTSAKIFIGVIFFALLPLAVLGTGFVVFIRRRSR